MKILILSIPVLILTFSCGGKNHINTPGNDLILYANNYGTDKGELILLDYSSNIEYKLDFYQKGADYRFLDSNNKIIHFHDFGLYDIYDFDSKKLKSGKINALDRIQIYNYQLYRDSLIIFSDYEHIYLQSMLNAEIEKIPLNAEGIFRVLINKDGLMAVSYDSLSRDLFEPRDLKLLDLKSGKEYNPQIKPVYLSNWISPTELVYSDSLFYIMHIPSFTIQSINDSLLDNFYGKVFPLSDSTWVMISYNEIDSDGSQLYIYNWKQKNIRKITDRPGSKDIFDVSYKP